MCRVVLSQTKREVIKEIGKKCREIRISKGYSQKDVAEEIGEVPNNISMFERGTNSSAYILNWYVNKGFKGV